MPDCMIKICLFYEYGIIYINNFLLNLFLYYIFINSYEEIKHKSLLKITGAAKKIAG